MKVLIVDDEFNARKLIRSILEKLPDCVSLIEEASDLKEAVEQIRIHHPHLVFLDIEMPGKRGTQIFDHFEPNEINFDIVFTTAYSEFAVRAFEMNAIDYLLKPIRPKKLSVLVENFSEKLNHGNLEKQLAALKTTLEQKNFTKIGLPVSDGIEFVEIEEIMHIEADGMYTHVHLSHKQTYLVSKPLKFFLELLQSKASFYRPHRSHLINLKYLKKYFKTDGHFIVLENEIQVPLTREKREEFNQLIRQL